MQLSSTDADREATAAGRARRSHPLAWLWAPGVQLLGRLSFRSKAALITLAFGLPLAVLTTVVVQDRLATVRTTATERSGVAVVRQSVALLQAAQQLRALSLREATGQDAPGVAAARQALDAQLARTAALDPSGGDAFGTRAALSRVQAAAGALAPNAAGLLKVYASHAKLSDALYSLIVAAADGSGLTLDPDLDTYYLMSTGILRLPRVVDEAVRMRGLAAAVAVQAQGGEIAAVELNRLDTLVEEYARLAQSEQAKVIGVHPESQAALDLTPLHKALDALRDQATDAPGSGGAAKAAKLEALGDQVLTSGNQAQAHTLDMLDTLLAAREQRAWQGLAAVGAVVLAGLLAAAYLFTAFYLVMDVGLSRMRRHLARLADGDLTRPALARGNDELAQLMQALGEMQRSLCGIVSEVRGAAVRIASASAQIAGGASDMSGRTEHAAASLQQQSTAMQQISATVSQTAGVAAEAARLADENASVAGEGGRIVGQMVQTMDEINGSSRRIADILGVIDGIAFQTNILALNAAVEAARAGELGRGFAVVAAEVRQLAQRSGGAAREIRTLIAQSVDKVEAGAEVVRHAGQTMDRIVDSADRIRTLLGQVAQGAQQQSQGLADIGGAVRALDDATQHNAALSEQTAAAAGSLKDQAHHLVDEVARFQLPA